MNPFIRVLKVLLKIILAILGAVNTVIYIMTPILLGLIVTTVFELDPLTHIFFLIFVILATVYRGTRIALTEFLTYLEEKCQKQG